MAVAIAVLLVDRGAGLAEASYAMCITCEIGRSGMTEEGSDAIIECLLLGCKGGVGKALGGSPGETNSCAVGELGSAPGEKGGVWVKLPIDKRSGLSPARGVERVELWVGCPADSWPNLGVTLSPPDTLPDVWLGEEAFCLARSRLVGFTARASAHGLLLMDKALISSDVSVKVFRLALRRSLIPPADGSRRAALRKSPLPGTVFVWGGMIDELFIALSSFARVGLLERFCVSMCKLDPGLLGEGPRCSSTQPAGVGGTGPSNVPSCGGCRAFGRGAGSSNCLRFCSPTLLALCERDADGGGRGGGPGKGIPGTQLVLEGDLLPVRLVVVDEQLLVPSASAETALFDAGGLMVKVEGSACVTRCIGADGSLDTIFIDSTCVGPVVCLL